MHIYMYIFITMDEYRSEAACLLGCFTTWLNEHNESKVKQTQRDLSKIQSSKVLESWNLNK